MAAPRSLGLDWAFPVDVSKWEQDNDRLMMEAVNDTAAKMPVICAYVPAMNAKQTDWVVPLNMLAAALNQNAYANLTVDPDDFVRSQALTEDPAPMGSSPAAWRFAWPRSFAA